MVCKMFGMVLFFGGVLLDFSLRFIIVEAILKKITPEAILLVSHTFVLKCLVNGVPLLPVFLD